MQQKNQPHFQGLLSSSSKYQPNMPTHAAQRVGLQLNFVGIV